MVCSINKLCYQYVNRVQPASYNIENSLYSPDDFEEEDNCAPPEDIGDHFVISLNIHLSNIFYYPITQKERSIMGNQPYVNANIRTRSFTRRFSLHSNQIINFRIY